jgi:hypothetical protein
MEFYVWLPVFVLLFLLLLFALLPIFVGIIFFLEYLAEIFSKIKN